MYHTHAPMLPPLKHLITNTHVSYMHTLTPISASVHSLRKTIATSRCNCGSVPYSYSQVPSAQTSHYQHAADARHPYGSDVQLDEVSIKNPASLCLLRYTYLPILIVDHASSSRCQRSCSLPLHCASSTLISPPAMDAIHSRSVAA